MKETTLSNYKDLSVLEEIKDSTIFRIVVFGGFGILA